MNLSRYTRIQLEALVYRQMIAMEHAQNSIRTLNEEIGKRPQEDILPAEEVKPEDPKEGE